MTTEAQAHETTASIVDATLTEVHAGSDMTLKVKISCPSKYGPPSGETSITSAQGAVAKEAVLVPFSGAAVEAAPPEVPAGSNVALRVAVSCPSKCNLEGGIVRIAGHEGPVVERIGLVAFDGAANRTGEFVVRAPAEPGEYTWTAVFASQDKAGILHEESSAPFTFVVKPHTTSMAVWDVPSPITLNTRFRFKVGVQCSAECNLEGKELAIYDHAGTQVATATLGDLRWSDTSALYWAEVELDAPGTEGLYAWAVRFPKPDLELPHEGTSYTFTFRTARHPEHVVTVEVLDEETNAPVQHADVILHPYRGNTDERGMARLMAPKGDYDLYVSASGRRIFHTTLKVVSDVAVRAELLLAPLVDESG